MSDKILIIGGGFAGFWAAVAARRVAGPRTAVTLVSREPALEIRPRLYEARPETLAVALPPLLREVDVSFVRGEAIGLDTAARAVTFAAGDSLAYDRLVVATGSRMRRPPVPGAEAAFSVDTQAEAIAFDRRLGEIARDVSQPAIAVVGAGFTGIELALELRDRLLVHGGDDAANRLRIVLIDRAETVGPELGPGPRPEIEAALAAAGVELRLGAAVQALAADRVSFADGSVLSADAVVLATGMAASPSRPRSPARGMGSAGSSSIVRSERPPRPRSSLRATPRRPIPAMGTLRSSPASTRINSAASPARTRRATCLACRLRPTRNCVTLPAWTSAAPALSSPKAGIGGSRKPAPRARR